MNLGLALYSEGSTDQRFLQIVIRRTARHVLEQHGRRSVNVPRVEPIKINKIGLRQDECILQAAYEAARYHILIVHADADHPTRDKALSERYQPGYERVQQIDVKICKNLFPVIPVYMTEAWMLADLEALRDVIETDMRPQELRLPRKAKQVELDTDPKQTLKEVLQKAYAHKSRRHRRIDLDFLYEPLALRINLGRLSEVPAYQQFKADLIFALKKLDLIR